MSGESANPPDGSDASRGNGPGEWPPVDPSGRAASEPTRSEQIPRPPNEVTARRDPGTESDDPSSVGTASGIGRDEVVGRIAEGGPRVGEDVLDGHSFALCLTHDVDRPYKLAQALLYAIRDRDPGQLRSLLPSYQPNWTFDRVTSIEDDLGVRSAFYFLDEQRLFRDRPVRDWFDPEAWRLFVDRYDVDDPAIVDLIHRLHDGGWEIGLHGSYESYDDRERLRREKQRLEEVLGEPVRGGRQHYLNRTLPETWEHHAALGLEYDATVGSSSEMGFRYGDTIDRPFDDAFVAFPLTIMDVAMPDPGTDPEAARDACDRVLREAADRGAIATVLWHPRTFNETDWPGHAVLYRHLIERAQELGAWIGSPADLYDRLDHPDRD